ncbi:hypothetical protein RugamoR57_07530 [Duganella caerulea]|uniref:hypothetical protein n=1 Tax=Duganella caerulea TaxID=2885762 RepID=UPI0030E8180B
MSQFLHLSPTVPPRRNELGAQLARFETLCRESLDASAKLSKLNLRCGRDLLQQSLPWMQHWLRADSPAQRRAFAAGQHAPDPSALTAYMSAAGAVSAEWLAAYRTWIEATLSNSGEQWLRALNAPNERLGSWSAQALSAMRQVMPAAGNGAAAINGAAGNGAAPAGAGAARSHPLVVA